MNTAALNMMNKYYGHTEISLFDIYVHPDIAVMIFYKQVN